MRTQRKQDVAREDGVWVLSPGVWRVLGCRNIRERNDPLSHETTIPCACFACHVDWRHRRYLGANQEVVVALDDSDKSIRVIAEMMLDRSSPRPQRESRGVYPK
jgi:hypothetical protein